VRQPRELRKPRRPYRRGISRKDDANKRGVCADCQEFGVDLLDLETGIDVEPLGVAVVYVVVAGAGRLIARDGDERFEMRTGDAWLVPASLERHRLEAQGSMRLLQARTKGAA